MGNQRINKAGNASSDSRVTEEERFTSAEELKYLEHENAVLIDYSDAMRGGGTFQFPPSSFHLPASTFRLPPSSFHIPDPAIYHLGMYKKGVFISEN